jgi:hypothetical protein
VTLPTIRESRSGQPLARAEAAAPRQAGEVRSLLEIMVAALGLMPCIFGPAASASGDDCGGIVLANERRRFGVGSSPGGRELGRTFPDGYRFTALAPLIVGIHPEVSAADSAYILETLRGVLPAMIEIVGEPQALDTLLISFTSGTQYFSCCGDHVGEIVMGPISRGVDSDYDGRVDEDPYDLRDNDGDGAVDEDVVNDRPWDNLFIHELTHAFQMEILCDHPCPSWVTEGMAEAARFLVGEAATAAAEGRAFSWRSYAWPLARFDLEDQEAAQYLGGRDPLAYRPTGFANYYLAGCMQLIPIFAELAAGHVHPHPLRRLTEELRADLADGEPYDSYAAMDQAWTSPIDGILPVSRWMRARSIANPWVTDGPITALRPLYHVPGGDPTRLEFVYLLRSGFEWRYQEYHGELLVTDAFGAQQGGPIYRIRVAELPPGAYLIEWTQERDAGEHVDTLRARTWILRRSSDEIRLESQAGLGVIFVGDRGRPVNITDVEVNGRILETVPGGMVVAPISGLSPDGTLSFYQSGRLLGTVSVPGDFTRTVALNVTDPTLGGVVAWEPYRPVAGDSLRVWLRRNLSTLLQSDKSPWVFMDYRGAVPLDVALAPAGDPDLWSAQLLMPAGADLVSLVFLAGRERQGMYYYYVSNGADMAEAHAFRLVAGDIPAVVRVDRCGEDLQLLLSEPVAPGLLSLETTWAPEGPWLAAAGGAVQDPEEPRLLHWEIEVPGEACIYYRVTFEVGGSPMTLFSGVVGTSQPHPGYTVGLPFPNPSPDGIRLQISLDRTADFELRIFDVLGRQVRAPLAMRLLPGNREISWNGMGDDGPLPSGVFFLTFAGPGKRFERRVVLTRDRPH